MENLLPEEIEMIRNEIYARHGYSFSNLKIRRIFESKDWYIPMSVDIREQLTDIEAQNIDLLYNYEDYYMDYYDSYGR
ncbi:MAG: YARHG domain-containing protein [Cytophagaceae bacterium]